MGERAARFTQRRCSGSSALVDYLLKHGGYKTSHGAGLGLWDR